MTRKTYNYSAFKISKKMNKGKKKSVFSKFQWVQQNFNDCTHIKIYDSTNSANHSNRLAAWLQPRPWPQFCNWVPPQFHSACLLLHFEFQDLALQSSENKKRKFIFGYLFLKLTVKATLLHGRRGFSRGRLLS